MHETATIVCDLDNFSDFYVRPDVDLQPIPSRRSSKPIDLHATNRLSHSPGPRQERAELLVVGCSHVGLGRCQADSVGDAHALIDQGVLLEFWAAVKEL